MSKEKICGIYKITSPKGRIYIGQSRNCCYRMSKYKGLDCKRQSRLYNSIISHGWDSHVFEIIHICNIGELDYWENYYIEKFDSFDTEHGLNLIKGTAANGSRSKETKIKNSIGTKMSYENGKKQRPVGSKNPMYGNGHKLKGDKNGRFGMPVSEETRRKSSESNKKAWDIIRANGGRKLTDEHKAKISKSHMGIIRNVGSKRSNDFKIKVSKLILNTQNGIFYFGIENAANSLGLNKITLGHRLRGKLKNNTPFIYA